MVMKTIEIEDDVYAHLLRSTVRIGESASEILRRLLGLPEQGRKYSLKHSLKMDRTRYDIAVDYSFTKTELSDCLNSPEFLAQSSAVRKFLYILSYMHRSNPEKFSKVLAIEGRHRKYFGRSSEELNQSGNKVMPQRIPDSPYWVSTNNDTPKKRRMLADALKVLGYDSNAINQAMIALV